MMREKPHSTGRFLVVLVSLAALASGAGAQPADRRVALTFDDIPTTLVGTDCAETARYVNDRILAGLDRAAVSATGFVYAGRTCGLDPARLRDPILRAWLDAGHDLGNHTWSHPDLEDTPLQAYLEDVRRGGRVVDALLRERGKSLVWFRHPMLHAGETPEKKRGLARFLRERGWSVAPVTVDNQEYVYAYVYQVAHDRGDTVLAERVAEAYLDHLEHAFEYFETRSREVIGREIPQVLLLHANRLNADMIEEVIALVGDRGYRVVELSDVMEDPAYRRGDPYVGPGGPSWIERWAVAEGGRARRGPREASWIAEAFRRLRTTHER